MHPHLRSRNKTGINNLFEHVPSETIITDNKKPYDDDPVMMMMMRKRVFCFQKYKTLLLLAAFIMIQAYLFWDKLFASSSSSWSSNRQNVFVGETKSLLGILLVGKADLYTLQDWLHRHVELFEKLAVIDGSESEWVRDLLQNYEKDHYNYSIGGAVGNRIIHRLSEASLNLSIVNDQSLRAPAMSVLGDPVGKWIMICHPDEFWVMDPRQLIDRAIQQNNSTNLIRPNVLWASPFESTYQKMVQLLDDEPSLLYNGSFHIQQVCNMTHHRRAPNYRHDENRLFQWQQGMRWGAHRHSLVVPEFINDTANYEEYITGHIGFYVHFKLHDFSKKAIDNGRHFANSKLKTGVHNLSSTEGWMGTFLDLSFPDALKKYPPQPLETAIQRECRGGSIWYALLRYPSMCTLPLRVDAKFTSDVG